jgi:hypothetical protein
VHAAPLSTNALAVLFGVAVVTLARTASPAMRVAIVIAGGCCVEPFLGHLVVGPWVSAPGLFVPVAAGMGLGIAAVPCARGIGWLSRSLERGLRPRGTAT